MLGAVDGQRRLDLDLLVENDAVIVEPIPECVRPVRDFRDAGAGNGLSPVHQRRNGRQDRVDAALLAHRLEAEGAGADGGDLGTKISRQMAGDAHVLQDDRHDLLVELAALHQLDGRQDQAFLEDLSRVRRQTADRHAAEIGMVGHRGGNGDRAAVGEYRHQDGDIGKVGTAVVRDRS